MVKERNGKSAGRFYMKFPGRAYITQVIFFSHAITSARVPSYLIYAFILTTKLMQLQSTMVNSSPSEFRKAVRMIIGAELTVLFNIGSQWSVTIKWVTNYP